MMLPQLIYVINEKDNVGTATSDLEPGREYDIVVEGKGVVGKLRVRNRVPRWYKVALSDIPQGEAVVKFGYCIGRAAVDIPRGCVVHVTHVVLYPRYSLYNLLNESFVLGYALRDIKPGDFIRTGYNVKVTHPKMLSVTEGSVIGVALSAVKEGDVVRLGNIVEESRPRSSKYVIVAREFYKFVQEGILRFSLR